MALRHRVSPAVPFSGLTLSYHVTSGSYNARRGGSRCHPEGWVGLSVGAELSLQLLGPVLDDLYAVREELAHGGRNLVRVETQ